ncbi:MAG: hypothetical protein ACE5FC_07035 [Myxococcota bacterium]
MRVDRAPPRSFVLLLGKKLLQLLVARFPGVPLVVIVFEGVFQPAPSGVLDQNALLFRRGAPALGLDLFKQTDGGDVVFEFLDGPARADLGVGGDAVV